MGTPTGAGAITLSPLDLPIVVEVDVVVGYLSESTEPPSEIGAYTGAVWRVITTTKVYDGSTWQTVTDGWVWDGSQWKQFIG
jgi:hypothetical protein